MKKVKRRKFKIGIFHKIVLSYVIFALLTFGAFLLCMLLSAMKFGDGKVAPMSPYYLIDEEGRVIHQEFLSELGAWVETLDKDYNVINVQGKKLTKQKKYTSEELFLLTEAQNTSEELFSIITRVENNQQREYVGFMKYNQEKEEYYLIMYKAASIRHDTTFVIDLTGKEGVPFVLVMTYVVFFGLTILNVLLLSFYIRRKIKKPIDTLMKGMEQIKAGKGNVALQMKTEAEFEQIMDTFNVMSMKLEQEKEENEMLVKKKNRLLLELSHDIKTPIATIKSYSNALEAGLVPEEKKQSYYHTIDQKAERILNLSEDMFLMLKMDYPDYKIQLETTDLCELLRKICAEYYEEIEEAGFEFEVNIPEKKCMLPIDVRLFTRVIGNLLTNARKYNHTGKKLFLTMTEQAQELCIKVMDDGEEIEREMLDSMFDAFSRGDRSRSLEGGTGLGLAIAKSIVEKHDGRIYFEREQGLNCFIILMKDKIL